MKTSISITLATTFMAFHALVCSASAQSYYSTPLVDPSFDPYPYQAPQDYSPNAGAATIQPWTEFMPVNPQPDAWQDLGNSWQSTLSDAQSFSLTMEGWQQAQAAAAKPREDGSGKTPDDNSKPAPDFKTAQRQQQIAMLRQQAAAKRDEAARYKREAESLHAKAMALDAGQAPGRIILLEADANRMATRASFAEQDANALEDQADAIASNQQ